MEGLTVAIVLVSWIGLYIWILSFGLVVNAAVLVEKGNGVGNMQSKFSCEFKSIG